MKYRVYSRTRQMSGKEIVMNRVVDGDFHGFTRFKDVIYKAILARKDQGVPFVGETICVIDENGGAYSAILEVEFGKYKLV